MKRRLFIILALGILTLNQGCDKNNSSTGGGATNSPAVKKLKLAFVTNTKNDFWATVRRGCDNAALNLGNVDVDFRFFTGSTVEEQQQILNDLVAGGVEGMDLAGPNPLRHEVGR